MRSERENSGRDTKTSVKEEESGEGENKDVANEEKAGNRGIKEGNESEKREE